MKSHLLLLLSIFLVSGCSSTENRKIDQTKKSSTSEPSHAKAEMEKRRLDAEKKEDEEYRKVSSEIGCQSYSLQHSKQLFSMALKYYGTNPSTVTISPELWAETANRACYSGYSAGKSGQSMAILEQYMFSAGQSVSSPFEYRAVSDALYWGYGRSMR